VAGGETMVFDEIDAGIGGETAHAVGETLRRLAERAQVITITHLPQIATVADRHFSVEKIPGDPTHTRIDAGESADKAWRAVLDALIQEYETAQDHYFRGRAADLRDLRDRVLDALLGGPAPSIPSDVIVLAEDLAPFYRRTGFGGCCN